MKRRVLIVDDSRAARAALAGAVATLPGVEPVETGGALEALRELATGEFALVLSDLHMPAYTGLDLVRFVRASDRHREVPVVLVTSAGEAERAEGLRLGASACLPKPVDAEALRALVLRHLAA